MKRLPIADIVLSVAVVALVTTTIATAVARVQRDSGDARCQSNLRRWGEAMALYCADNNGRHPSNRPMTGTGANKKVGAIMHQVHLSPDELDPATGQPYRHVYGVNWVEALYDYLEADGERTDRDWKTVRACPKASSERWPMPAASQPQNYFTSYAMNRNLVEYCSGFARNPQKLVMLREFGRHTVAILRPLNDSTGNDANRPQYAFMNNRDLYGATDNECRLHGEGSYILFADGHVRHFTLDYYPEYNQSYNKTSAWDPETAQWYNYYYANPSTPEQVAKNKSIAVSP